MQNLLQSHSQGESSDKNNGESSAKITENHIQKNSDEFLKLKVLALELKNMQLRVLKNVCKDEALKQSRAI